MSREYRLYNATPHELNFTGLELPKSELHRPPRANIRERELGKLALAGRPGEEIPLYELDFNGLEDKHDLNDWMNSLGRNMYDNENGGRQALLVTSYLVAIAAKLSGQPVGPHESVSLGYPANIQRSRTGEITGATRVDIPMPVPLGSFEERDTSHIQAHRDALRNSPVQIINQTPDALSLVTSTGTAIDSPQRQTLEPHYSTRRVGTAQEGVEVHESRLHYTHPQLKPSDSELIVVHSKAWLAYWQRVGDPHTLAHMAVPYQQREGRFGALAVFSAETLDRITRYVQF